MRLLLLATSTALLLAITPTAWAGGLKGAPLEQRVELTQPASGYLLGRVKGCSAKTDSGLRLALRRKGSRLVWRVAAVKLVKGQLTSETRTVVTVRCGKKSLKFTVVVLPPPPVDKTDPIVPEDDDPLPAKDNPPVDRVPVDDLPIDNPPVDNLPIDDPPVTCAALEGCNPPDESPIHCYALEGCDPDNPPVSCYALEGCDPDNPPVSCYALEGCDPDNPPVSCYALEGCQADTQLSAVKE